MSYWLRDRTHRRRRGRRPVHAVGPFGWLIRCEDWLAALRAQCLTKVRTLGPEHRRQARSVGDVRCRWELFSM